MTESPSTHIRFDHDGLVPVVVQDADGGDVLMLAFMNEEALRLTYATGEAHYWSRSRQKIWRKGETSGHTQSVEQVLINCEQNSLLLFVQQSGAVCHDGFPTCYYRRLEGDGSLTRVRDRAFDPEAVYGDGARKEGSDPPSASDSLAVATRRQFGAYVYLRNNDFTAESATSQRLRTSGADFGGRVGDELRELAGVLDGRHRHADFSNDLRLEASQVMYWAIVEAVRRGVTWVQMRPDTALTVDELHLDPQSLARLLTAESHRWAVDAPGEDFAAKAHAALALVAMACRCGGLDPLEAVESDLAELRARSYLAGFFEREDAMHASDIERQRFNSG